jgi:alpha-1,6-mannosyltransferase
MFMDFSRRYSRALYNRFQRTLVPSPALGDLLASWGVRNLAHTDLGVDTAIFHPQPASAAEDVRGEFAIPRDRTLLLYVGRLAQEKNTQTLFAAFHHLVEQYPQRFHLFVVGDGLQRAELLALQRDTGAVTWLDYCAEASRLAALYRAADLFVHPGVQETFGLVTLEAQASGTPVVGIRGSYMDRIIHTDQTLWARENSAEALAAAVEQMSREDLSKTGAGASRRVAAQYSWTQVFTRMFDIYREAIRDYVPRA